MASWVQVAAAAECPVGQLKGVTAGRTEIVLANVEGTVYALEDECSHEAFPLSDGELEGDEILCIYHGARFDCKTGKNICIPATRPVRSFPVEVRAGQIYIDVS